MRNHPSQNPGDILQEDMPNPKVLKGNVRRLLMILPLLSIAASVTMAPRIEIFTLLACSVHKPEIFGLYSVGASAGVLNSPNISLLTISSTPTSPPYHEHSNSEASISSASPDQRNRCASDPVVRMAVAKLTAMIAGTSGILMCVTTGWWGSFSDRYGRKTLMVLATIALLVTDFNFILASWFLKHMPGGYWFLLIGPIADGLLGGFSATIVANQSYIADSTAEGDRSGAFSLALGLLFSGMALGPSFGSILIHFTGSLLSVYYLSAVFHVLYAIATIVAVPESLSKQKMEESRAKYSKPTPREGMNGKLPTLYMRVLLKMRSLFAFLTPLGVFLPVRDTTNVNPQKQSRRDWSLTVMIIAYSFMTIIAGTYSYQFQYATSTFNWSSETLGYWLSFVGASRAIHLSVFLPVIIKIMKPKPTAVDKTDINLQMDSTLLHNTSDEDISDISSPLLPNATENQVHSSSFGLKVVMYSLVVELAAFAIMGLTKNAMTFAVFGVIGALGSGSNPAAEAGILALYLRRGDTETGKLFGAVGVVQAICSQILGPAVFGVIYVKTVATYPRTIFAMAVTSVLLSIFLMSLIRLPYETAKLQEALDDPEEQGEHQ